MRAGGRPQPTAKLASGPRAGTPALLLRRFPYGESSLVLHALTPEAGRVSLLAKGAYRPRSGFFAVFDLFDTLEVRFRARQGAELGLVTKASVEIRRADLARDAERYTVALGLLELARLTAREGHEERTLFGWLERGLDLLQAGRAAPGVVAVASDLALLAANGLAPALEGCASCGEVAHAASTPARDEKVLFSPALGGRICTRCASATRTPALESLPPSAVRVAQSLMNATPVMLENMHIERPLLERVRAFVARFLEYHLEARPRSRRGTMPSPQDEAPSSR